LTTGNKNNRSDYRKNRRAQIEESRASQRVVNHEDLIERQKLQYKPTKQKARQSQMIYSETIEADPSQQINSKDYVECAKSVFKSTGALNYLFIERKCQLPEVNNSVLQF
jgi:tryptophan 2,3-dioxygenase